MYWCETTLIQNSEQWMKTEDCCASQHHHEMWNDWIEVMKIMKYLWKQWEYSMYCRHLFPSGADVIQMDRRDSFIHGLRSSLNINCFKSRRKREVWESSSVLINQKLWERWWVIQLLEIVIDWNDFWVVWEQRDWFGQ